MPGRLHRALSLFLFAGFWTLSAHAQIFVFDLGGDQEVPPVASSYTGGCFGQFDSGTSSLALTCVHDVVGATIMHVHRGAAGVNGAVAFDMGNPTSPVTATWSAMAPADVADLLAGNLYINIHTAGRPSGEIRGQILPRTVDTVNFTADGSQVVPPGASPSTANCTADLDTNATFLNVQCTHTMASPDSAHIHQGSFGQNGPVVFTFPSPASPINANVPMTPELVAAFAGGLLYFDLHYAGTSEGTADEIRGQIGTPPAAPTTGSIRIVKATSPSGATGFGFTDDVPGGPASFTLNDGQTQTFLSVPPGTYTVFENDPASSGYTLTDVVCGDSDSTANPFSRSATIQLQAGEVVTCTFHNLLTSPTSTLFVFHLSGDQEVPPVSTTARGGCMGQFDAGSSSLALVCTHDVVNASVMHVHRGAAGVNGPVAFDLGNPESPVEGVWTAMTPADVADLLAGNLYVNIHSGGRPAGEIRGQILPRTVDSFQFVANGTQEVPPTTTPASAVCSADLATNADSLAVQCDHTVSAVTSIHLHDAPAGLDGPVVYTFANGDPFSGSVPMTPRLVADFAAGFLYMNIHTTDFPQGEIRGQLVAAAAASLAGVPTLAQWMLAVLGLMLAAMAWWRLR